MAATFSQYVSTDEAERESQRRAMEEHGQLDADSMRGRNRREAKSDTRWISRNSAIQECLSLTGRKDSQK